MIIDLNINKGKRQWERGRERERRGKKVESHGRDRKV